MSHALPDDVLFEKQQPWARQRSTALATVAPDPLTRFSTAETPIWKRLDGLRMSDVERRAAIDALLLGREIGRVLQQLARAVRRWLGSERTARHVGHSASFRRLARMRGLREGVKHRK